MSINLYKKKTINNQPVLEELLSKSTDTVDNKPLVYDSTTDNVKSTDDLCVNTVTANCFCGKATCADIADVACAVCVNDVTGPRPILTLGSDGKVHNTGNCTLAGQCCIITPILRTNYIFPTSDCNTIELYNGIYNDEYMRYENLTNLCYTPFRCLYDQYDCTCCSRICFENKMRDTDGPSINGIFCSDWACTYSYFKLGKNFTCYHRSDPINKICSTMLTSCAGHIFLDTCKWNYGENIDGQGCLCLDICNNTLYSKSCLNNQYNYLIQDCSGTCICSCRRGSTYCPTTLQVCFNGIKTNSKNNIAESYLSEKPNSFILHTCDTTNCKTGSIEVDSDSGYILHCTCNGNCGKVNFSQDGVTFIQNNVSSTIIGDQFSGNAATATNADNSTCFNGCTYSEACIDIRDGLATQTCADAIQNCADYIQSCVSAIESKIPAQASASNQLADKDFVNSSITTNTANFRGTYACVDELPSTGNTNNDYAFVCSLNTTTGNYIYDRYKWVASDSCWVCEYELNTTGFTAEQLASINSGITDTLVAKITDVYDNTVTVCMNGECKGSFSLNQNTDVCIDLGDSIRNACNANYATTAAQASEATNATCFNNCTYACAKEDIRNGMAAAISIGGSCPYQADGNRVVNIPAYPPDLSSCDGLDCTGTVTQVKVGETAYDPVSGIVSLPEYPVIPTTVCTAECANTVKRNTANSGSCYLALFDGNTAVNDANLYVSSAKQISFCPYTGCLSTCYVRGISGIIAGNPIGCTSSVLGQSGTNISSGTLNLYTTNPSIGFHVNDSAVTSQSITARCGALEVCVNNRTGCTGSTETATYCFGSGGFMAIPSGVITPAVRSTYPAAANQCCGITFMARCCNASVVCNYLMCLCGCDGKLYNDQGFTGGYLCINEEAEVNRLIVCGEVDLGSQCDICIYDTCGNSFICGWCNNLTIGYNSEDFVDDSHECCRIIIGLNNHMCANAGCADSIVVGYNNNVCWNSSSNLSFIYGYNSTTNNGGLAVGGWNITCGECAVVLGWDSFAQECSISIGLGAYAHCPTSIAIGCDANTCGCTSIAIGYESCTLYGPESIAIGCHAITEQPYAIAIGCESCANGVNGVAIGSGSEAEEASIAIGNHAYSNDGPESIAIGCYAKACCCDSIAIGPSAISDIYTGLAIGFKAKSEFIRRSGTNEIFGCVLSDIHRGDYRDVAIHSSSNIMQCELYKVIADRIDLSKDLATQCICTIPDINCSLLARGRYNNLGISSIQHQKYSGFCNLILTLSDNSMASISSVGSNLITAPVYIEVTGLSV